MDTTELIDDLLRKSRHHQELAERYRVAADVLRDEFKGRGAGGTRRPAARRGETAKLLLKVVAEAAEPLDVNEIVARMESAGWKNNSRDPANTVRTAANRMSERDELMRVGRSSFAPAGYDAVSPRVSGAREDSKDVDEWSSVAGTGGGADPTNDADVSDPWGTAPDSQTQDVDQHEWDEPPF